MNESLTLDMLKVGESAEITSVSGYPLLRTHLMELGFVVGSIISFVMSTPFGDPNIYFLRGTSIALRKNEAKCISVKK